MQSKVKRLSTLACASFTWLLGVSREITVSILRKNMPQHRLPSVSITPLSGPFVANIFASLMQRDRHPPATLYGASHMSSLEPVSRKRVRSVGGRFIKHCRNAK